MGRFSLVEVRDQLFKRHGAPPDGIAASLVQQISELPKTNTFLRFLKYMGVTTPRKAVFCEFLRQTVRDSIEKGYSKWTMLPEEALWLRLQEEPRVAHPEGMVGVQRRPGRYTFFLGKKNRRPRMGTTLASGWGDVHEGLELDCIGLDFP